MVNLGMNVNGEGWKKYINLICLREVSVNGMVNLGMNVNGEGWKKYICERIQECGRRAWKDGFNDTEREKKYVRMKESPRNLMFCFDQAQTLCSYVCMYLLHSCLCV